MTPDELTNQWKHTEITHGEIIALRSHCEALAPAGCVTSRHTLALIAMFARLVKDYNELDLELTADQDALDELTRGLAILDPLLAAGHPIRPWPFRKGWTLYLPDGHIAAPTLTDLVRQLAKDPK